LRFTVLENSEVRGLQIGYLIPFFIGHDNVELNDLRRDLYDIFLVCILRRCKNRKKDNTKKRQENSLFHCLLNAKRGTPV